MRFGVFLGLTGITWDAALERCRHIEATGWDAVCVTDHFMPNTPEAVGDTLECWSVLTAVAALVPRIHVGSIVVGNTYRHPAVLAKMATTVDIISGGRLLLGLGAGWQENEHRAYGIPFYTVGERLARLAEACEVLTSLWTRDRSTFNGRFYHLENAPLMPKPVQRPHPELMIGGGGEKVTLRIAAKHADHWNVWGGPEILARKNGILDDYCQAIGRDPRSLRRSANMVALVTDDRGEVTRMRDTFARRFGADEARAEDTLLAGSVGAVRDKLARLRDAGVDMLWVPTLFYRGDPRPQLDRFIDEIAPSFR